MRVWCGELVGGVQGLARAPQCNMLSGAQVHLEAAAQCDWLRQAVLDDASEQCLEKELVRHFGFSKFREGDVRLCGCTYGDLCEHRPIVCNTKDAGRRIELNCVANGCTQLGCSLVSI